MAVNKTDDVLLIGTLEPTFEAELLARYKIRKLPDGAGRAEFLAEHAAEFRVAVTWGPPVSTPI